MKRLIQAAAIAALLASGASLALAQTDGSATSSPSALSKVSYPVAELGNCDSRDACKLYCDSASHVDACFAFAQKVGLMTKEKIAAAKIILSKKGPGSCSSRDECVSYCADSSHQDECLSFAKEHKVIASTTVMLIQKINSGSGPGACKSAATCKMYCEDSSHEGECRSFAEENGLLRRLASTSQMRPDRMGTSTSGDVRAILASTTPGRDRGMELHDRASSTTPAAALKDLQRKLSSTTSPKPAGSATEVRPPLPPTTKPSIPPSTGSDDLGATVLRGFAHLLGF